MYDGPERRRGYPDLPVLVERWTNFMENTEGYRKELCGKIDKINAKLDDLPCKIHETKIDELHKLKPIFGKIIFWGITSLIIVAVAWGSMRNQVDVNTDRLNKIEGHICPNTNALTANQTR